MLQISIDELLVACKAAFPCMNILQGDTEGMVRFRMKIPEIPNRSNLVWMGGSVLAEIMQVCRGRGPWLVRVRLIHQIER